MKVHQGSYFYHYESVELKAMTPKCFDINGIQISDGVHLDKRKIDSLIHGKAYYAKLSSYNDPLESRFTDSKSPLSEEAASLIYNRLKKTDPISARNTSVSNLMRTPAKYLLDRFVEAVSNDIGYYCLSEYWNDVVMWAHYASNHSGIVLEFEKNGTNPCSTHTFPINYKESPDELDLSKLIIDLLKVNVSSLSVKERADFIYNSGLKEIYYTKSKKWSYENEWRTSHKHGLQQMPGKLTSIIFGYNTKKEVIEYLTRLPELDGVSFEYIKPCFNSLSLKKVSKAEYELRTLLDNAFNTY